MPNYAPPTPTEWKQFQQLHIAFGHQSLGANLIAGVQALALEQHIDLSISDITTSGTTASESKAPQNNAGIQHFHIGANGDPISKLEAFSATMASDVATRADIAEMKFCFVDFGANVDPKKLATTYIDEMTALSLKYPDITFIATTSPLTTIQTGPKAWIKRLLGKDPAGFAENFRRHKFNQVLRDHYGKSPTLFDLAAIESLHGQVTFEFNQQTIEALAPVLSSDGGHLNADGERLLATTWIRQLSTLKPRAYENSAP